MPIPTRPRHRRRGTPRAPADAGARDQRILVTRTLVTRTLIAGALVTAALAGGRAAAGTPPSTASARTPGAGTVRAAAPPAADAPIALVPGIAFGWTDAGTEALLALQLVAVASNLDQVTDVRLPAPHLTLAGYRLDRTDGSLLLRVRADRSGDVTVRHLQVALRYAPARTLHVRAAEVLALPGGDGPLTLRRWASDDAAGLYAAFALVNESPAPVTVHALRYAPRRLGRGLVLIQAASPGRFEAWKDRVLERTEPAFAAYLRAGGHDPRAPARTPAPASLAFPLNGALAEARWRASDALDATVAPGEALFLAVTPAAFSTYVDDLAITAYPVLAYRAAGGCCRLQGVGAPIVHVVDAPNARTAGRSW